jgi:hypothetical protein
VKRRKRGVRVRMVAVRPRRMVPVAKRRGGEGVLWRKQEAIGVRKELLRRQEQPVAHPRNPLGKLLCVFLFNAHHAFITYLSFCRKRKNRRED